MSETTKHSMSRRQLVGATAAAGVSTLLLPSVAAAASSASRTVGNGICDWDPIPFLAVEGTTIVQGVTVTCTYNSGIQGNTVNTYLHQSNVRIRTVLEFSSTVYDFKLQTRNHADAGAGKFETYTFTWKNGGTTVNTAVITNVNTTETYYFPSGMTSIEIDYTHTTPATPTAYGSYLDMWLPCVSSSTPP